MNNPFSPSLKRPLLLIGAGIGIYLVVSYFFGVLVGFIVNTALFIGIIFYIRKKQTAGLRSFGFDNNNNSNISKAEIWLYIMRSRSQRLQMQKMWIQNEKAYILRLSNILSIGY
jgi:hypothetical protein